jgi:hypothetical protein
LTISLGIAEEIPVNSQFLEFFGNFLLTAAKGQKQLEQMTVWMKQGFSGFEDLTRMFQRFYGLEQQPATSPDQDILWEKAVKDFQGSFSQCAELWGWVTREDHQVLQQRCAELEKTVAKQQQTIAQLQLLLEAKGLGPNELLQRFQTLVKDQGDEFQSLIQNLGKAFHMEGEKQNNPKTRR